MTLHPLPEVDSCLTSDNSGVQDRGCARLRNPVLERNVRTVLPGFNDGLALIDS